jgi:hypothetical protein
MRALRAPNAATNSTHEPFSVASVLSVSSVFPLESHDFLCASIIFTNRSKSTAISCGPGLASGWPWKL